jgi:hypothetical protein
VNLKFRIYYTLNKIFLIFFAIFIITSYNKVRVNLKAFFYVRLNNWCLLRIRKKQGIKRKKSCKSHTLFFSGIGVISNEKNYSNHYYSSFFHIYFCRTELHIISISYITFQKFAKRFCCFYNRILKNRGRTWGKNMHPIPQLAVLLPTRIFSEKECYVF